MPMRGCRRQRVSVGGCRLVGPRRPGRPGNSAAARHAAPQPEGPPLPRPLPARRPGPRAHRRTDSGPPSSPGRRGGPRLGTRPGRAVRHRHHHLPHLGVHRHRVRVLAYPGPTPRDRGTRPARPAHRPPRRPRPDRARHPGRHASPHPPGRRTRRRGSQVALPGPVPRPRPLATADRHAGPPVPDLDQRLHQIC